MINNRQNGRRRGRGGQQARNGQPGAPDRGNRLDNRARGNAAQLLEKYKTLARDAQMQGDRVNTEYYLQFADHYFRVLSESRARFDEQRPRQSNESRDDYGDEDGNDGGQQGDQGGDDWDDDQPQVEQRNYAPRQERAAPQNEGGRNDGSRNDGNRSEGGREGGNREITNRESGPPRRRSANAAPNGNATGNGSNGNGGGNGFTAPDFLNEPIAPRFDLDRAPETVEPQAADASTDPAEEAPKRRRTRRPRGETSPAEA